MIHFSKKQFNNQLPVIINPDPATSIVTVNVLYNVGSKHESADKTGFAHLFEHLMFGGSLHISSFDHQVEKAGGTNNAFTNSDFTSYYISLPSSNLEMALWLESDRMLGLNFSEENLSVQKNVVIEEFKQNYLNQPYGDVWLLLRPLAYKQHPYQWPTIGKEISHIEQATLQDVKDFYYSHYAPNNAIISISGNVHPATTYHMVEKWFSDIEQRTIHQPSIPQEPPQKEPRSLSVERNVPLNAIYKAYHMCSRTHPDFYATDMISDILSNGISSRLYQKLVKEKKMFYHLDAFISGEVDTGLFLIAGKLHNKVRMEEAEEAINAEIENIKTNIVEDQEIIKVKNKFEAQQIYQNAQILNRAIQLSYFELIGDAEDVNKEVHKYQSVTPEKLKTISQQIFQPENCSTLYYYSKSPNHAE